MERDSATIARRPPTATGWTDQNQHDPGITMLGLFAFLTSSLLYRAGGPSDGGRTRSWAGALGVGLGAAAVTVWYAKSRSGQSTDAHGTTSRTDGS